MKALQIKMLAEQAERPAYETEGSAGMDLKASVGTSIKAKGWGLVKTGLSMAIPLGYEGQVRSRSGLALKKGVFVLNGVGTIDSDYRGEVGVILFNAGESPFLIKVGDRIAQFVINKVEQLPIVEVDTLDTTIRGEGGFGSTGV